MTLNDLAYLGQIIGAPGGKALWKERTYLFGEEFRRYIEDEPYDKTAASRRETAGRLQHRPTQGIN